MYRSGAKPALWFAIFVVLIDALGMSIIFPILPDLLIELTGRQVADIAIVGGALIACYAVNHFLFAPVMGALSDRYGRRPLLLVSLSALVVDYIIMAAAWNIWLLFLGRILAGMAGGSYAVANAYISDVTDEDKRAANFGLVGAAFGIGFVIGPLLGGTVAEIDIRAPFVLAAILCFFGFLFGLFVLPESLAPENRRPFSLKQSNPFASLARAFQLRRLRALLIVFLLMELADHTFPAVWSYWSKESFGWSAMIIGLSLTYYGVGAAVVEGGLIRLAIPKLGEAKTIWIGMVCFVVSMVMFGFATEGWMVFAIMPVAILAGLSPAALRAVMTRSVSSREQGELQGVVGSITAVASVASPLAMTWVFFLVGDREAAFYMPGLPYLIGAVLVAVSFVPLYRALKSTQTS